MARSLIGVAALVAVATLSTAATAQTVVNSSTARVVLGFQLECYSCDKVTVDGVNFVEYRSPPVVIAVADQSPASKVGLKPGDVLTHVNSVAITERSAAQILAAPAVGRAMTLGIRRNGQATTFSITPERVATGRLDYAFKTANFQRWSADSIGARKIKAGRAPFYSAGSGFTITRPDTLFSAWQTRTGLYRGTKEAASVMTGNQFNGTLAGLEVSIDGNKPVKISVVEPDCILAIDVDGTRILLKVPGKCK